MVLEESESVGEHLQIWFHILVASESRRQACMPEIALHQLLVKFSLPSDPKPSSNPKPPNNV